MSARTKMSLLLIGLCLGIWTSATAQERIFRDVKTAEEYHAQTKELQGLWLVTVKSKAGEVLVAKKDKVKPTELDGLRVYIRHEPRVFRRNKETGKKEFVGGWGLDLTDEDKKFSGEPRRRMEPGSVIPGDWVGDVTEHHYELKDIPGPFAERLNPTSRPVRIVWEQYYEDGSFSRAASFGLSAEAIGEQ